jgi:voltage-gated potassium channel
MAGLAITFVIIGFAIDAADATTRPLLELADMGLTVVFAAEFASRFLAAWDRRAYLRGHWIDLLALVPVLRGFRVLRLLRLLRLVRAFAGIFRATQHFERMARHRGLAVLFVTWLAVMVICSIFLYAAENGTNEAIASPLDALWWGIVTLTTVGYGDVYPVTPEGRIAASVLMLLGIGLFSAITATITSFMLSSGEPPANRLVDSRVFTATGCCPTTSSPRSDPTRSSGCKEGVGHVVQMAEGAALHEPVATRAARRLPTRLRAPDYHCCNHRASVFLRHAGAMRAPMDDDGSDSGVSIVELSA